MSNECAYCMNDIPFEMPDEIIEAAKCGNLVLFCGAGISTENKNVLPFSFYKSVCDELDISDDISFPELMQTYCELPNGRRKLIKKIRERFQYINSFSEIKRQATAFHKELSEIHQIKTIITTNWDTYFEEYCGAVSITIPEDFTLWDEHLRHVIKIHGSMSNIGSIIATTKDYEKCYHSLQNGIIGATLKSLLATKTVVFIGFSFGDEDFDQILRYLCDEMGELFPHIYTVSLDKNLKDKLEYKNSTNIITSGLFFIRKLKEILVASGNIVNCNIEPVVECALDMIMDIHSKTSRIDINSFPSVIFTLAYQDGVIHAFERFKETYKTGEYNHPCYISAVAKKYQSIIYDCHKAKNYWDEAYFEGYLNGIIFIGACESLEDAIKIFPFLYLPNAKKELNSLEIYHKELKRVSSAKSLYHRYASNIVKKRGGDDMVLHHPPF